MPHSCLAPLGVLRRHTHAVPRAAHHDSCAEAHRFCKTFGLVTELQQLLRILRFGRVRSLKIMPGIILGILALGAVSLRILGLGVHYAHDHHEPKLTSVATPQNPEARTDLGPTSDRGAVHGMASERPEARSSLGAKR